MLEIIWWLVNLCERYNPPAAVANLFKLWAHKITDISGYAHNQPGVPAMAFRVSGIIGEENVKLLRYKNPC